ncbi:hypothetical protein D3C87_2031100 [compost metagenome]
MFAISVQAANPGSAIGRRRGTYKPGASPGDEIANERRIRSHHADMIAALIFMIVQRYARVA